jgi:hypothetical protein
MVRRLVGAILVFLTVLTPWGQGFAGEPIRTFKHSMVVASVAFSPDGRRVLTGSFDKTARLWDTESGRSIRTFKGHSDFVISVAFSPDGRRVLTGSTDLTARLWDARTVAEIYRLIARRENIAAYLWFTENLPNATESRKALAGIHRLAFEEAEDIDTLEAYNDFVIAYPFAEQAEEANRLAYELEEDKYSGWFSNVEKQARALLIQSKRLERKMKDLDSDDMRTGYLLVIDRMSELLQNKYPAEEATLRYLES